jgi:undecaprenyl-diphosphatase
MWRLWLTVAFTFVIVDGVAKPFMNRARPYESLPEIRLIEKRPTNSSFPSGHAAMAVAGAPRVARA